MSARTFRTITLVLGIFQIAAILFAFERPANAYVDPGSGYVFLQIIGSMIAGAIFYLRHRIQRVFSPVAGDSPASDGNSYEGSQE